MGQLDGKRRELRKRHYKKLLDSGLVPSGRIAKLIEFIAEGVQQDFVTRKALLKRGARDADISDLVRLGVLKRCRRESRFRIVSDPLAARSDAERRETSAHHPSNKAGKAGASKATVRRAAACHADRPSNPENPKRANRYRKKPEDVGRGFADWAREHENPVPVAPAERSYEVFRDEHAFRALGRDSRVFSDEGAGIVNLDPAVEDYIASPDPSSAIVVAENRAAYMSLKRLLVAKGAVVLFGRRVGGVVYKVSVPSPECIANLYRAYDLPKGKPLLFWGDIDRAGAAQLLRVTSNWPGEASIPPIEPYAGAYRAMVTVSLVDLFAGRDLERASDSMYPLSGCVPAASLMSGGDRDIETYILAVLASVSRVPQEAVPFTAMLRDAVPLANDR